MYKKLLIGFLFLFPLISFADVTQTAPSRTLDTVYQNTTGYPLFVGVAYRTSLEVKILDGSTNSPATLVCDNEGGAAGTASYPCFAVIPNTWYYKVTAGGTQTNWIEWPLADVSGGGGSVSTSTVLAILASVSISSTTAVLNNPNQDYFNGLLLFFGMLYFTIWFFRK